MKAVRPLLDGEAAKHLSFALFCAGVYGQGREPAGQGKCQGQAAWGSPLHNKAEFKAPRLIFGQQAKADVVMYEEALWALGQG